MLQDLIGISFGFLLVSMILSASSLIVYGVICDPTKETKRMVTGLITISIVFWIVAVILGGLGWIL